MDDYVEGEMGGGGFESVGEEVDAEEPADVRAQCYITFYGRKLRLFIIC
jgi:hypothetical protein